MRIGIIGCGWLGWPLAEKLIERGHTVVGTTTTADKLAALRTAGIEATFLDLNQPVPKATTAALRGCQRLLINVPPGRRLPDVESRYPAWMRRLATLAVSGMDRCLFASSTGIYGTATGRVDEAVMPEPVSASGKALLAAEPPLRAAFGERLVRVGLAGLVGGRREAGRFLAGKTDLSDGEAPVNLVHRVDVVALLTLLLEATTLAHRSYLISADAHPTRAAFYPGRARQLDLSPPTFLSGGHDGKWIDNARIKGEFNYTFQYPDPRQFPFEAP